MFVFDQETRVYRHRQRCLEKNVPTGVHSSRLAASKAHRRFVTETKKAVQKLGWEIPDSALLSPSIVGAQLQRFPVPQNLARAFGYRGNLRFLELGYCPRSRQFGYCDGGDHIASDENLWLWFLHHPIISTHLPERRYPTLYGIFPPKVEGSAPEETIRDAGFAPVHCLLLDLRDRKTYICRRDQTMIFFALMEPEGADHHTVFVDGLLMSPGTEDYKGVPPTEFVHELRTFLDAQLELRHRVGRPDFRQ